MKINIPSNYETEKNLDILAQKERLELACQKGLLTAYPVNVFFIRTDNTGKN